jgi:glucan-binding YG repeat protein
MALLDGLTNKLTNPLFEEALEEMEDEALDFDMTIEAVTDKALGIELSEDDIAAILDDDNPDNIAADLGVKDEEEPEIEKEVKLIDSSSGVLEALLGFGKKSSPKSKGILESLTESDDEDDEEDEEDDEDDEDDTPANEALFKKDPNKEAVLNMSPEEIATKVVAHIIKNNKYVEMSKDPEALDALNEVYKLYVKNPGKIHKTVTEKKTVKGYPVLIVTNAKTGKFDQLVIPIYNKRSNMPDTDLISAADAAKFLFSNTTANESATDDIYFDDLLKDIFK